MRDMRIYTCLDSQCQTILFVLCVLLYVRDNHGVFLSLFLYSKEGYMLHGKHRADYQVHDGIKSIAKLYTSPIYRLISYSVEIFKIYPGFIFDSLDLWPGA